MSETLDPVATELDQRQLAEQLLAQAKEQGVGPVGPNGLLNQLTKNVLETALDAEMTEHMGYDKHDPVGRGSGNSRNGSGQDGAHRDRAGQDRGAAQYEARSSRRSSRNVSAGRRVSMRSYCP
jgi:transposase-like protein